MKESVIDFTAGIRFYKKTGDYIKSGDVIAELYSSDKERLDKASEYIKQAYCFGSENVFKNKTIIAYITKDGIEKF